MSLNLAPYQTDAAAYVRNLFARQPEVKSAEVEVAGSEDVTVIFADGRHLGLHLSHAPDYHGGFDLDPATAKRCGYLTEEEAEDRVEEETAKLKDRIDELEDDAENIKSQVADAEERAVKKALAMCRKALNKGRYLPDKDDVLAAL